MPSARPTSPPTRAAPVPGLIPDSGLSLIDPALESCSSCPPPWIRLDHYKSHFGVDEWQSPARHPTAVAPWSRIQMVTVVASPGERCAWRPRHGGWARTSATAVRVRGPKSGAPFRNPYWSCLMRLMVALRDCG
jgi:hypothetical protein